MCKQPYFSITQKWIVGVMDEKLTTEHTESKYNPE